MFLYQLVNLVLETCFIFSEILKLSKTFFCLEFSRVVWSLKQRALWFSYSRLFFGIVFYKVNCGVHLGFLTHLFEKMFYLLTCKKNHNFDSRVTCRECLLFKRLRDMVLVSGQNEVLLVLLSFFLMLGNNACFKSSNCRWAPCSLIYNQRHGLYWNR